MTLNVTCSKASRIRSAVGRAVVRVGFPAYKPANSAPSLDTCVISELVTRQPSPAVVQWVDSIDEDRLFLSAITIGEIKRGIEKLADSRRKSVLHEWLEGDLLIRFKGKILPIDTAVMLVWGQLVSDLEKQGKRMPAIDSLIAATCLQGRLDLVTRNETDFAYSGVTLINPWTQ